MSTLNERKPGATIMCKGRKRNGDPCRKRIRRGNYCTQHSDQPVGRPTKFTEETRTAILDALRAGVWASTAAEYAGVTYETFRTWMRRGEDDLLAGSETEYAVFSVAVKQTVASVEVRALGLIQRAAIGDWRAAAWWAQHALPSKYGRREAAVPAAEPASLVDDALLGGRQPFQVSEATQNKIIALLESDKQSTIEGTAEEA
jgi:hypothetical protein